MALRPDGRPPTEAERYRDHLADVIMAGPIKKTGTPQTNSTAPQASPSPAELLLAADIQPEVDQKDKLDVIIAATSQPFVNGLHTEAYRNNCLLDYQGRIQRADSYGSIRFPNELAQNLGLLRISHAKRFATYAVQLILSAEAAKRARGITRLNPCFEALAKQMSLPELFKLQSEALRVVRRHFGTIRLKPNITAPGFDLVWWKTFDAVELVYCSPLQNLRYIREEIDTSRSFRRDSMGSLDLLSDRHGQQTEVEDKILGLIRTAKPLSCSDFVNIVLPPEDQAVLALEGLYEAHTEKSRSGELAVDFAGRDERVSRHEWSQLLDAIMEANHVPLSAVSPALPLSMQKD